MKPYRMVRCPAAMLISSRGTNNGDTFFIPYNQSYIVPKQRCHPIQISQRRIHNVLKTPNSRSTANTLPHQRSYTKPRTTILSRCSALSSLGSNCASLNASSDAATAICANRPIFRTSSLLRDDSQPLSGTIPATVLGKAANSSLCAAVDGWAKRDTIPDSPAIRRVQDCFTEVPRGERRPTPVTTTLLAIAASKVRDAPITLQNRN